MKLNIDLDKDFEDVFIQMREEYPEFIKLDGLDDDKIDPTRFFKGFIGSDNVANSSIDDNSNVNSKAMPTLLEESRKAILKLMSFNKIFIEMKEMFDLDTARTFFIANVKGDIYLHDSVNTSYIPYCYSYSVRPIVEKGLFFIEEMKGDPAKHLSTFHSHILETVAYLTNLQSGAIGLADVLVYSMKYWIDDVESGYIPKDKADEYRTQGFQKLVYELNQPYLKQSIQSAYTNFSFMDRNYYLTLFGGKKFMDGTPMVSLLEEFMQYQLDFMEFMRTERSKRTITFPVLSANLIYADGEYKDEKFAKAVVRHNMTWEDISINRSDNANVFSACCFDGDQEASIEYNNKQLTTSMKALYDYGVRKCDITCGLGLAPATLNRIPRSRRQMYRIVCIDGSELLITEDHLNPIKRQIEPIGWCDYVIPTIELKRGDHLLSPVGHWNKIIESIDKYDTDDEYVYCFEMDDQTSPYFVLPNGILTHNCRMEFDSDAMDEGQKLQGNFNSIGGSDLNIGSSKVVTINLPRVGHLSGKDKFDRECRLRCLVDIIQKFHAAHRQILQKSIDRGLLPNYSSGMIDMNRQFATVGVTGFEEFIALSGGLAVDTIGELKYNEDGVKIAVDTLEYINKLGEGTISMYGYTQNIEQIPGESANVKLPKKDNMLYADFPVKKRTYSNQWCGLDSNFPLEERIRISGILDSLTGGGQILHVNMSEPWQSFDDAWNFACHLASMGVKYWSIIRKIQYCDNDHNFFGKKCPHCGLAPAGDIIKIVGYLTKNKFYKSERKEEVERRRFY